LNDTLPPKWNVSVEVSPAGIFLTILIVPLVGGGVT